MKKTTWMLALGAALLLGLAGAAQAALYTWDFPLSGLQEVQATPSPATGAAHVTADDVFNQVTWNITYAGLLAPLTAAHFHGFAPPGINAAVKIPIPIGPSPLTGSAFTTPDVIAGMVAGDVYVNLHTQVFPGGEIRGQVVPVPTSLLLLGSGLLGLVGWKRKTRG